MSAEAPPAPTTPPAGATPPPVAPTATTPTAPTASLINSDGTLGENWHTALGDEFAPHAAQLGTFKNVAGLAKSYLHLQKHGPTYPGEGAQPEDISRFHQLAQVPGEGTPMAYGIQLPEDLSAPEKGMYDRIAGIAHKHHVPGPALKAVVGEYQAIQKEILTGYQQEQAAQEQAAEDSLIAKWGTNFEPNKSTVRHVLTTLAANAGISPDDPAFAGILNNPALAQIALEFSKATQEGTTRTPTGYESLQSPQQRADAIMAGTDPAWGKKYTEGNTEERTAAYQEVVRLTNLARK